MQLTDKRPGDGLRFRYGDSELFCSRMKLFFLTKPLEKVMMLVQSESVTLSVDYLISSAQAGRKTCLGFFVTDTGVLPEHILTLTLLTV